MGRAQQRKKKGKERLDRYYHLAKEQGFRARSAFKLIQLAQKYDLFTNCRVAVDLCAAPGGWLQVCARHMPLSSLVVGVDLAPIQPIKGCTTFQSDITTQDCRNRLRKLLQGHEADLFLHDGSPNMGMDWSIDAFNQNVLVLHAAHLACDFLRRGGLFVSKVFRSSDYASLLYVLQQLFTRVEATKPQASRNVSAEIFVVCKGFKKPDVIDSRLFDPKFAFLAVDEEPEEGAASGHADASSRGAEGKEAFEAGGAVVPAKAKVKLSEALKIAQKRNRGGYSKDDGGYKVLAVREFLETSSPVETLLGASELRAVLPGEARLCDLTQRVLSHPLTTPEVKDLWGDLKVLGKRDILTLLKWRFKIRRDFALQEKRQQTKGGGTADAQAHDGAGEDEDVAHDLDEKLATLHSEASRLAQRQQRKAAKRQRLLQTKQQFSRNAFAASERDPDLFRMDKQTVDALAKEPAYVDAQLLLTGDATGEGTLPFVESLGVRKGGGKELSDALADATDSDSDLDALDRMEVDLEVGMRLRALAAAEKGGGKAAKKETRRARVLAEKAEEMRAAVADLQSRSLEHLARERQADEMSDTDEEEEDRKAASHGGGSAEKGTQQEELHEYIDEELPVAVVGAKAAGSKPSSSGRLPLAAAAKQGAAAGREEKAAERWFSQSLFSVATANELADSLLTEEFDPVVPQPRHQEGKQQQDEERDVEIKELSEADIPQIPLSDKQKRQQQRRKEEEKKAARAAKAAANGVVDDVVGADDGQQNDSTLVRRISVEPVCSLDRRQGASALRDAPQPCVAFSTCFDSTPSECLALSVSRIEEVPAATFEPPRGAEEAAEFEAMGAMLIRRSSRMDLIDGAYNRYAFNDDELPDWFVLDEEKHNKPELPVTKELMQEYKQKIKEINARPIRKVREAAARKKKRAQRILEKMKRQAQGIANSAELSEAGKAKAIARLSKKARQATARKEKALVVSRRVGGGKATQKAQGGKGGARAVKLVDRRLKKDKRAMLKAQAKGKGKFANKGGKRGQQKRKGKKRF
ncbi:FTSJ-like methyltransferase domain-containing protein [Cyclospora cayetanensis]|uniref:Putative rRNA methyltransferase n=1 Tax=Cyclospora cayetanensis TaxID=88456 RepID=A0A1D3CYN9_9EIME|nr:FTSJ-like methyltransferase domain-containing protein [Cyclospora cayetanensis]